ncbi:HoxN/HupN/NixA family nickel/cobalt transporter [Cupriavidus basilensis]
MVTLMSIGIAPVAAAALQTRFADMKAVGGMIGTSVSALFLFLLAFFNLLILISVWRAFRAVKRGEALKEQDLDLLLNNRGVLSRLFRPLFRLASRSWHLFPMGLLFGLGFRYRHRGGAVRAIGGGRRQKACRSGPSWCSPRCSPPGMSLVDTTDGILMLGAYGWAFTKPIRKLYYNMTITLVSVIVAVVIGGIEALGLIADKLGLEGGLWDVIGELNAHFGMLGHVIIGVFVLSWLISMVVYRVRRYR